MATVTSRDRAKRDPKCYELDLSDVQEEDRRKPQPQPNTAVAGQEQKHLPVGMQEAQVRPKSEKAGQGGQEGKAWLGAGGLLVREQPVFLCSCSHTVDTCVKRLPPLTRGPTAHVCPHSAQRGWIPKVAHVTTQASGVSAPTVLRGSPSVLANMKFSPGAIGPKSVKKAFSCL